jgi:hypothetical protein
MKIFAILTGTVLISLAASAAEIQVNAVNPDDKDEKFEAALEKLRETRQVEGGAAVIGEPSTSDKVSKIRQGWDKSFENDKNVTNFGEKPPAVPKKKKANNKKGKNKKGGKKKNNKKKR